uniref:Alternative protein HUWE1 n=1 Tax=Homo sapiens TaxID=9606 RepID=L8E996_HUMAN|nr:alternative protein HUWE1 [Homo sapiens]
MMSNFSWNCSRSKHGTLESASYITGWTCWTASMEYWQMLDRQWRICHGCSYVIGQKESN